MAFPDLICRVVFLPDSAGFASYAYRGAASFQMVLLCRHYHNSICRWRYVRISYRRFVFNFVGTLLVKTYHLETELEHVSALFQQNAFWAIFTAAFTPIPYKIFTIAGGLFRIDFLIFVIASILGRGMRFFAVAYLMKLFGGAVGRLAFKYFNLLTLVVGIVIIGFLAYKFF